MAIGFHSITLIEAFDLRDLSRFHNEKKSSRNFIDPI